MTLFGINPASKPRSSSFWAARGHYLAGIDGVVVHVHAYELFGQPGFHVARELHRVLQRLGVIVQRVLNAVAHHAAAFALDFGVERAQEDVAAQRQRKLVRALEPPAQIDDAVEAFAVEGELRFVNDQTRDPRCARVPRR